MGTDLEDILPEEQLHSATQKEPCSLLVFLPSFIIILLWFLFYY